MNDRIRAGNSLLSLIRIGLGISWLNEGIFKLQAHFTMSGLTQAVVSNTVTPDWYKAFMQHVVAPNSTLFNWLIPWGEILVGAGLITGMLTQYALISAVFMNLNYWLANMIYIYPLQLVTAISLLMALKPAARYRLTSVYDYFANRNREKT